MRVVAKIGFAVAVLLAATHAVSAQCPDGSPPPCGGRPLVRLGVGPVAAVPTASDRSRRFLILPFRNVSRQPDQDWLVEGSTTMLVEALGQWKGITVVSDDRLYPALKRAGIVPGTVADVTMVRRVAEETGGWTAVTGEVLSTGGRVRITARAWDVPTSRELVRASSEIPIGGDVRQAYDLVSLKLLRSAGFDSATSDLASATTRNLDAYRSYLSGLAHMRRSEVSPALKDFQDAVRMDSSFALAWARLAEMSQAAEPGSIFNPQSAAARYSTRAAALAAKLPPRDRDIVLASDASMRAQFGDARRLLEALVAADSNDVEALSALVGLEQFDPILVNVPGGQRPRGNLNRAARLAKRTVELDPTRHAMFGLLASLYASAGVPGSQPTLGVDRAPTSFPDLIQLLQQREHRRVYTPLFGDSLFLVPVESVAVIPKDSLKGMQKAARQAGRGWGERWIAAAPPGVAVPYALMAELYALDNDYPNALGALATAESLGVQTPTWSTPARRLFYSAKAGNLTVASRLADSLTATGFFANSTNMMINGDAGAWAFALHLFAGRMSRAGTLLDQRIALQRLITPSAPAPDFTAFVMMMGNQNPEDEPAIPRSVRVSQLDTMLAHVTEAAAVPQLGPWLPILLPILAEVADTTKQRLVELVSAADALATAGRARLAFELASNAVVSDSTLEAKAAKFPWYRAGAEPYNAVKRAAQERFSPRSATVAADRAVFEWTVADSAPFTRNRVETPIGRSEYRWEVTLVSGNRNYRMVVATPQRSPGGTPASGTLGDIVGPTAQRFVTTGIVTAGIQKDTTALQAVALRTELAPGALRMVVTDRAVLDELRQTKPAEARFRFLPCVRPLGSTGKLECKEGLVKITYP
jgi:TolB-like protein